MLNYLDELKFSNTHSENRIEKAYSLLGENLVNKIIGFVFFLLGANREQIAKNIDIPLGTFLSFLTRIDKIGIFAFGDRRSSTSLQVKQSTLPKLDILLQEEENNFIIMLNDDESIRFPKRNSLQCKIILLTFLDNGLLSLKEVSQALNFSTVHTRQLCTKLHNQDAFSLIDKRKGQLIDYAYTPDIKAEMIKQFTVNVVTGGSLSSKDISKQLNDKHDLRLSDRSVRFHMNKLGLHKIAKSLSIEIENLKKTQKISDQ
ncbi:hypothetical protein A2Z22_02465 [Candidatus Woesebacteria bacterium RBG_16_34_12]|uniref:Uncharacterized protein n=1 Tax=Candidatus Woesebacteria bacterium RBG_16_34_12 TaxID=1802480 RepID=A0A1F7XA11_9BACT|nr:MAG: hypothetical protein A2Z22_02465 [Candidatus Woesebacteria bacterium RBG_16_34_12]